MPEKEGVKDIRDLVVGDVDEISLGNPATVKEDALIKEAVEVITSDSTSSKVYVIDGEGRLKGAITIEILLRHVGYKVGVRETGVISFFKFLGGIFKENVTDIMETPVTITKRHKLLDALRMMEEYHLNDLPVIDEEERIIGELNSLEILKQAKQIFED
jgi:CBS domain-containing protein